MLNFGIRKQGFHIAVSIEENDGDNSVIITMIDEEGTTHTITGAIVFDE